MYGLIVFIAGMSVMMLEIAGIRILSPYFGSSFIVSTSTIGIILAALSLGYYIGGKLADKSTSMKKLAFFVFIAGLYNFITSFIQFKLFGYISLKMSLNFFIASIIASIFLFAIPSILLGIVSPYVIKVALNSQKDKENTGNIVGKLYAFSTLGSILGTFLCGFYLILYFGMEIISFVVSFCIFLCSVLCYMADDKKNKFLLYTLISFIVINFFFIVFFKLNKFKIDENSICSKTSMYQYLTVNKYVKENQEEILTLQNVFDDSFLSVFPVGKTPEESLFNYHELFYKVFVEKKDKSNVLLLGNGAGIFLNAINSYKEKNPTREINVEVVEIDKVVTELAQKFFQMKSNSTTSFYHEDARTFVNKKAISKEKTYDLIYLDVYKEGIFMPASLTTVECMEKFKSILADNGMLLINVIGSKNVEPYKSNLNQVYTQTSNSFENVVAYQFFSDYSVNNFVVVAYKNVKDKNIIEIMKKFSNQKCKSLEKTNELYTDKFSPYEKLLLKK